MGTNQAATGRTGGGRGARERILKATAELFAGEGIHVTGVAKVADAAHVSIRTLYQHFPSKEALVTAYLHHLESGSDGSTKVETVLGRADLSPRERLLALFAEPSAGARPGAVVRGCAFHNAVVEGAGALPEAAAIVERYKADLAARLVETAAEAGAPDPETLGRRLAVVFEGARALATSINDPRPFGDARGLAALLIDDALGPA